MLGILANRLILLALPGDFAIWGLVSHPVLMEIQGVV